RHGSLAAASRECLSQLYETTRPLHLPAMCMVWYAASAITNTAKKSILTSLPYPVTVTIAQFLAVAVLCAAGHANGTLSLHAPTWRVVRAVAPLGLFQLGGHLAASSAISTASVAFVHTVKSLSPLFTVLLSTLLLGTRYSKHVWVALIPLMAGVVLACALGQHSSASNIAFNVAGFMWAAMSTVVFVLQSIFSKRILLSSSSAALPVHAGHATPVRLDKINIMAYSSVMALCVTLPMWLSHDLPRLLAADGPGLAVDRRLLGLLALNGLAHFTQALLSISVLARVSTVTFSITSLLKRIVIIVAAILWFGESVSGTQAVGVALTFVGLWMYQR
ncbi:triose-phosphate transporter family-domain-containing protein, partial [Blastocladiella britannica]